MRAKLSYNNLISEYSPQALATFSEYTKLQMALEALKNKDYELFENIIKNCKENIESVALKAAALLDERALSLIAKHHRLTETESNKITMKIYNIDDLTLSYAEVNEKRQTVIKALSGPSPQQNASESVINFLIAPVYLLKRNVNPSVVDVMLSRTYAEGLTEKDLRKIYSNLYELDPIAQEMLTYLAIKITNGDNLEIYFKSNLHTSYDLIYNTIKIDHTLFKDKIFNLNSVVIHEIGHCFYEKIFANLILPINRKYFEMLGTKGPIDIMDAIELMQKSHNPKIIEVITSFEEASKLPVNKAVELLGINQEAMASLNHIDEHTEYLKLNSIINVFFANDRAGFTETKNPNLSLMDGMMVTIYNIYFAHRDCDTKSFFSDINKEAVDFVLDNYLPAVVAELNLTATQVHFITRISDYLYRGESKYRENLGDVLRFEKYTELIVRYAELKAAGVEEDLLESFSQLVAYHQGEASPMVAQEILMHLSSCKNISDVLINEGYCIDGL
jgi:hypothetical protein